ncbi:Protein of uncharacterised function (DUF1435) [Serratia rubidaea]|nr:Protein of uncharacterised function (DUF1435) [Serratia rubidaea]
MLYDIGYHYHLRVSRHDCRHDYRMWVVECDLVFGGAFIQRLGVLLPCALLPLLAMVNLDMMQLRSLIVIAMLATLVMLFNSRWRHYLLLPSCMALAGGLAAISLHFDLTP